MAESLAGLFKEIADAIRAKKKLPDSYKIPANRFVEEILTIGAPISFTYTNDGTLPTFLSNVANAIKLKRNIDEKISAKNFADEIYKISESKQLGTPAIFMRVEDAPGPDSLSSYITFSIYTGNTYLTSYPPEDIPLGTVEPLTLTFISKDHYHIPENVEVMGASYTWTVNDSTSGTLVLTNMGTDVSVTVNANQYKLNTPNPALYSTIRFLHEDGSELRSEALKHGQLPEYQGRTPWKDGDKDGDNGYKYYVFVGWIPEPVPVEGEADYVTDFRGTDQEYATITWRDYDDSILEQDLDVPIRELPVYNGDIPARDPDRKNTYTFSKWAPKIIPVYTDTDYVAEYTGEKNVQKFANDAGGLTYVIVSREPSETSNAAGGITYYIGDVEE